jgi:hypothetical protein
MTRHPECMVRLDKAESREQNLGSFPRVLFFAVVSFMFFGTYFSEPWAPLAGGHVPFVFAYESKENDDERTGLHF